MAQTLIALNRYKPGGIYTTSSTTPANVDATNLFIDFSTRQARTALVVMTAPVFIFNGTGAAGESYLFSLRDAAGNVAFSKRTVVSATTALVQAFYRQWFDITPGVNYRWFWAHCAPNPSVNGQIYDATSAGDESELSMEVWAEDQT